VPAPLTPEEEALVNGYWGVAPAADGGGGYQPNPGAPGYNPNPGAAPAPGRAVLGNTPPIPVEQRGPISQAVGQAFSDPAPLFQNPLAKPQQPVDLGEIDQPPPINLGDVDAPGFVPPAPAPFPTGPTPEDDAALAALNAKLATKPAPSGGGGGGARTPANPDPYGIQAANRQIVGSFANQSGAQQRMGAAQAYGAQLQADHHAELARRQDEDAAIARAEEDYAAQETEKSMSEVARQLDDVRAKKLKPLDYMSQGPAMGILAVLAGAMGGFYMGLTGGKENPVTADLDRFLERQMAIDEKNLDNEKQGLNQKLNLLGQQRQVHRDRQVANAATRMLVYEAAKEQLAADAANADVPWKKAAADAAMAELDRSQGLLLKQLGEAAQQRDRAAAAAAMARQKEVLATYRETYDKALSAGYTPAEAEYEAKRMIGNLYAPGSQGERPAESGAPALGKAGREELAKEREKARLEVGGGMSFLKEARAPGSVDALAKGSALGDMWAGAPGFLPGVGEARQNVSAREAYNVTVRELVGAAWRLRTGGMEPKNEHLIKEIETPFRILPTDDPATIRSRIDQLEKHLADSGRSKGSTTTTNADQSRAATQAVGGRPLGH
jgi:hypothetical protein